MALLIRDQVYKAEEFWDHVRTAADVPQELHDLAASHAGSVSVTKVRAKELFAWCVTAPGFEGGPEFAPHAIMFRLQIE